jgi:peptide/nickel transport system ATP-binding protein
MTEKLLEIEGLSVIYKTDEETVYAVNDIDLTLNKGETLGLVGETGAGKTTTALSIMRLLPDRTGKITHGRISLGDLEITKATEADMQLIRGNGISMVFQDPMTSLNPILTVGEQIAEVLHLHRQGMAPAETEKKVDEILELVGLTADRKHEYPHQFSGGMKQRVVIAMALACEPKLILADEPTTALDVTIQAQILKMMKELKQRLNTAMIFITHDLGVVAQICDRVAIMYAGEIIEIGTTEDIFEGDKHHPYTDGLFGSIPDMTKVSKRLNPIEGLMPDPTAPLSGCKFHPRCPKCMEICKTEKPQNSSVGTHTMKCHLFAGGVN